MDAQDVRGRTPLISLYYSFTTQFTRFTGTSIPKLTQKYGPSGFVHAQDVRRRTLFTRFTGTNVPILTQKYGPSGFVNAQDGRGRTPLMEAVRKHHENVVMVLIDELWADVNLADYDGVTVGGCVCL